MAAAVEVEDLWVAFRPRRRRGLMRAGTPVWGLRGVELRVEPGELVAVIGHNGSGKTTLLQSIAGVLAPTRGEVRVHGRALSLIDLTAGFHRELTGHENLMVQAALLGIPRAAVRTRYEEILAFSGLDADVLAAPLRTYSAGMGLRLGFSLIAHAEPAVALVDEVLAVGDEEFAARCLDWLDHQRAGGMAVVLVTHDLHVVTDHADRVVVLDHGAAVFEGDPERAVARYRDRTRKVEEGGAG